MSLLRALALTACAWALSAGATWLAVVVFAERGM